MFKCLQNILDHFLLIIIYNHVKYTSLLMIGYDKMKEILDNGVRKVACEDVKIHFTGL